MTRSLGFFLVLTACATTATEVQTTSTTAIRFRGPSARVELPHRAVAGARAEEVFRALQAALPPREAYELEALSCTQVSIPRTSFTSCTADGARVVDSEKAEALASALRDAGAATDLSGKMPAVRARKLRATRDALAFDDDADHLRPRAPNLHLDGRATQEAMSAMAAAGIAEDDGSLNIVCTAFDPEPACGYVLGNAAVKIGPERSRALWNAFVRDPKTTVLYASHFVYDRGELSFVGFLDAAAPPSTPPTWP